MYPWASFWRPSLCVETLPSTTVRSLAPTDYHPQACQGNQERWKREKQRIHSLWTLPERQSSGHRAQLLPLTHLRESYNSQISKYWYNLIFLTNSNLSPHRRQIKTWHGTLARVIANGRCHAVSRMRTRGSKLSQCTAAVLGLSSGGSFSECFQDFLLESLPSKTAPSSTIAGRSS